MHWTECLLSPRSQNETFPVGLKCLDVLAGGLCRYLAYICCLWMHSSVCLAVRFQSVIPEQQIPRILPLNVYLKEPTEFKLIF